MSIQVSSVDDLNSSMHSSIEHYTIKDFEEAMDKEVNGQNRKSIIHLLLRGIRAKKAGKKKL